MKEMKALRVIQGIVPLSLFLALVFDIVNQFSGKTIFSHAITMALLVIALVAIICSSVLVIKNRKK